MDNPYDVTDSERIERDWQQEQRDESRFLRDTYTDGEDTEVEW